MYGCINELYEYLADVLGLGVYSWDRFDTWRDILANTLGAVAAWLLVRGLHYLAKKL